MYQFDFCPTPVSDTTVLVEAQTPAAKAYLASLYGEGAVSVTLLMGYFQDWADKANEHGLTISA